MIRHTTETNGLNRSPITDAFRSVPHNPCRWLSNSDGLIPCMYVHVHMKRIHTVIKLLRSKIADCMCEWCVGTRCRRRYYSRSAYHRFKIIFTNHQHKCETIRVNHQPQIGTRASQCHRTPTAQEQQVPERTNSTSTKKPE